VTGAWPLGFCLRAIGPAVAGLLISSGMGLPPLSGLALVGSARIGLGFNYRDGSGRVSRAGVGFYTSAEIDYFIKEFDRLWVAIGKLVSEISRDQR
jgi:hypothetical protein